MDKQNREQTDVGKGLTGEADFLDFFKKGEIKSEYVADYLLKNESESTGKLLIVRNLFDGIMHNDPDKVVVWSMVFVHYSRNDLSVEVMMDLDRCLAGKRNK